MEEINVWVNSSVPLIQQFVVSIVLALLIFIVGKWLAGLVRRLCEKVMKKRELDEALISFTTSLLYYAIMAFVVIAVLAKLGVETTSFAAVIAAAGLAIGLALQGSLSNFASGVLIILFRPFSKGDVIEAGGKTGSVDSVQIFSTIMKTPDNKVIIMPNAQIMSGPITNYTRENTRRVDFSIGIGYGADLQLARSTVEGLLKAHPKVLQDQDFTIAVGELADSSVNLVVRCWSETADYWTVFFDITEQVKAAFDEKGIEIPFPQLDVHTTGK